MSADIPTGVVAIYILDGRVIAHAASFERDRPGGFTVHEAQSSRAKDRLMREVVAAFSSPALYQNLDVYDCERVVKKIGGEVKLIKVGEDSK